MSTHQDRTGVAPRSPSAHERHRMKADAHLARDLAKWRDESVLDKAITLAIPSGAARPERGPTVESYYRAKHAEGRYGKFYPLHQIAFPRWRPQ